MIKKCFNIILFIILLLSGCNKDITSGLKPVLNKYKRFNSFENDIIKRGILKNEINKSSERKKYQYKPGKFQINNNLLDYMYIIKNNELFMGKIETTGRINFKQDRIEITQVNNDVITVHYKLPDKKEFKRNEYLNAKITLIDINNSVNLTKYILLKDNNGNILINYAWKSDGKPLNLLIEKSFELKQKIVKVKKNEIKVSPITINIPGNSFDAKIGSWSKVNYFKDQEYLIDITISIKENEPIETDGLGEVYIAKYYIINSELLN